MEGATRHSLIVKAEKVSSRIESKYSSIKVAYIVFILNTL